MQVWFGTLDAVIHRHSCSETLENARAAQAEAAFEGCHLFSSASRCSNTSNMDDA